jgi:hypothetical protein
MALDKKRVPNPVDPLTVIPGVGLSIAADLQSLNIHNVGDLVGKDPHDLYEQLCHKTGAHQDACILYVFRCAVYFANSKKPDPQLLKWWVWKNREK